MFEKLKKFFKEKTSESFEYLFDKPKSKKEASYYRQARGRDFNSSIDIISEIFQVFFIAQLC